MDLDTVAKELYGLPPGQFTSQRNSRAAEARNAGDRTLADEIKKLRRPTTSAWLANLLVRERSEQLDELLGLGGELREAQAHLDGEQLRQLSRQRQRVVSALGHEALRIAADHGQRVSDETERELEASLEAAMADPAAADAVRSGRLTGVLIYTGLGPVDLSGAVAPQPASSATSGSHRQRTSRAQMDAERAWKAAESSAEAARRSVERSEQQLRQAEVNRDDLVREIQEAEGHLERLRAAELASTDVLHDAEDALDEARHEADAAQERASVARASLDKLRA